MTDQPQKSIGLSQNQYFRTSCTEVAAAGGGVGLVGTDGGFAVVAGGVSESDRASLEAMLIFKFGTIDPELKALIPKLLLLDPLARTQQIMTLSREALLESL
jgi:hypothetical protein